MRIGPHNTGMARPFSKSEPRYYAEFTHRPVNSLAFIALPLLFFEIGSFAFGTDLKAPNDIDHFMQFLGGMRTYLPPIVVVAVLLWQQAASEEKGRGKWRVQPRVLAGMLGESVFWTVPLIGIFLIMHHLPAQMAMGGRHGRAETVLMELHKAVGAGIYEEFVFRLACIGIVTFLLMKLVDARRDWATTIGVLIAAILFSLYHFSAQELTWAKFPWYDFTFRAMAGVYLGGVFVYRGFGIAVGVHSMYNICRALVILSQTH